MYFKGGVQGAKNAPHRYVEVRLGSSAEKERNTTVLDPIRARATPSHEESEEELRELCRLASEVPSLWQHEEMTHQERKEILRCLIDHIVVSVTEGKIDASIVWKT